MNPFKKILTLREILLGIVGGGLSYILIAFFNISNEDVYNMDISLIFSEGGVLNSISLIAFWVWFFVMTAWVLSVLYRILKIFSP